jgi:hypothetical protein
MLTVFSEYKAIKSSMTSLIEASGLRNDFLAKKIGISAPNFTVKKQRGNWNDQELEKLVEVLTEPNEKVQEILMLELMRARKSEPNISYDDYKKEIASWK